MSKLKILFVCSHNSMRSQMAEGLMKDLFGDKWDVYSAGVNRASINPLAIRAMDEVEIDISKQKCNIVDEFGEIQFDIVVTLCDRAREDCPVFLNTENHIHEAFEEPIDIKSACKVRDEIKQWLMDEFTE